MTGSGVPFSSASSKAAVLSAMPLTSKLSIRYGKPFESSGDGPSIT